jgi:hypothetical protein
VPIWFTFTRIEFAIPSRCRAPGASVRDEEVVADELDLLPRLSVRCFQPAQSFSASRPRSRRSGSAAELAQVLRHAGGVDSAPFAFLKT